MSVPGSLRHMPTLVGRERERALLRERLDGAFAGRGSLVLIGGEAGIGKTTLAETLCREAAGRGALVLIGRCYDLTATPPFGAWVDAFERYQQTEGMPPLPAAFVEHGTVGAVESQAVLFRQVADFFAARAAHSLVVLLLDDLHWADPASLDLLRFIARTVNEHRLLVLVTFRGEGGARQLPLSSLLPLLVREADAQRLDLWPLDVAAVLSLVADHFRLPDAEAMRLVDYLTAKAAGNVLFIGELLRALEETGGLRRSGATWTLGDLSESPVPPSLQQVIGVRLDRLDAENQRLLAVAAVIGQEVPYAVWTAVAGRDEDALLDAMAELETAHLMAESRDGSGATFAHALVREVVYEQIRPSRRRRWHRAAGEALAMLRESNPDAIAYHFQRAGDHRALPWLITAAEHAERASALLGAAERFALAANVCATRGDTVGQGWLLIRLAPLYSFSDSHRGVAALDEAGRLAGSSDPALAACALYLHGDLLCNGEEFRQGLAEMAEAIAMLDALPQGERARVQVSGMAAEFLDDEGRLRGPMPWPAFLGRYREAQAMAERAVAGLPSPGRGGRTVMRAYRTLAICHAAFGRPDEARAAYARNRAILRTLGAHAQLAINTVDELERVVLPYCTEQIAERRRMTREAEEEWRRSGGAVRPGALASGFLPDLAHVPVQVLEGRWDAVRATTQGRGALEGGSATAPIAARALGAVARHQGEATLAWDLVRAALPAGSASAPGEARFFDRVAMQRLAIALSLDADDLPAARSWLETYDRWMAWSDTVHGLSEGEALWARYHRAAGDGARAYAHAECALGHATAPRQPLALLAAHRLLGELDTDAGRYEDAETHIGTALTLVDACVAPFERALTLLAFAPLRAKTGDRDAATALLDEARAICIPLDAVPTLARIDALAARLALTSANTSWYPDALSQREVEVLRLLTQGMSNSAIAGELFVSVRTVERHIRNLYTKIDAHNRADATAYAFRHNLT